MDGEWDVWDVIAGDVLSSGLFLSRVKRLGNVKASVRVNKAAFNFAPEVFGDGNVRLKRAFDGSCRVSHLFAY